MIILPHKPCSNEELENGVSIVSNKAIKSPDELPSTVTALQKYLFCGKHVSKGGIVYRRICIAFDGDRETMLVDIYYELRDNEI